MRIEHVQDMEVLRQVAVLLDRENRHLHERLQKLAAEIDHLKGQDATTIQRELEALKELLAQRERVIFGDKSEKRPRSDADAAAPGPTARRGHGPRVQPTLPVLDIIHELDEADQICPQCGGQLVEMDGQTEDSEEVTVVERRFAILKHQRKKYRCACNGCVDTAPGPLKLQTGSRYSTAFAVEVAVNKYLDHLPLERQARIMRREGLVIDSQTLWDQLDVLARAGPSFTLAHCWAHVRRKYIEAEPHFPDPCRAVLDLIGQLYAVERDVPGPSPTDPSVRTETLALRRRLRQERSRHLVRAIRDWAMTQRPLPESGLGRAITYMLGLWKGLTLFLDDPRVPLDNNRTERGLRGVVLGRKNHYGSRSQRGTEVAALFYSLLESAKLSGVEPKLYLLTATRRALADSNTVTLPRDLAR